jgi:hypothetical protein
VVFDAMRPSSWRNALPYTLETGETLCCIFESYHCLYPGSRFCFEQFLLLAKGLLGGISIKRDECVRCGAAIVVDALGSGARRCGSCGRHAAPVLIVTPGPGPMGPDPNIVEGAHAAINASRAQCHSQ